MLTNRRKPEETNADEIEFIETRVGGKRQFVGFDDYVELHAALSEKLARAGFEGIELDEAIVAALPGALARLIN